ncbi:MAG: hypothetical protein H6932_12610 [Burkholderiaceae bacterium]|nr:hypothetical protein [Burkholderiaceae bacterium]
MDDTAGRDRPATARKASTAQRHSHRGGTLEPTGVERSQAPEPRLGERYELNDPFQEVTHRGSDLPAMLATAERLGSQRIAAVDAEGRRSPIEQVEGRWQRGPAPEKTPAEPAHLRNQDLQPAPPAARATTAALASPPAPTFDPQAERAALRQALETALKNQYVIKRASVKVGDVTIGRTEYRYRGGPERVAFTESAFRLATDTNSPHVARSMVDVAQARNWTAVRVSGHEEFRRMVWLEASLRGVRTVGYEPMPSDLDWLRSEREARQINRIEPARGSGVGTEAQADKPSARGGGGRKAVLAAIEALLVDRKLPAKQREAVMAAAAEQLARRTREGKAPSVRIYDRSAPSQRPSLQPTPELQRGRERAMPAPVR